MTQWQRRYLETHGGGRSPLLILSRHVREHGLPAPAELSRLAAEARVPEAALRGALTFYADLDLPPDTLRICDGTSCRVAAKPGLREALEGRYDCRPVYCVGYCHASPAALLGDRLLVGDALDAAAAAPRHDGARPAPSEPVLPSIRSLADPPLVTRRLGLGGAPGLERARELGAYRALEAALAGPPEAVLETVERSGERGRGGAGFPTGAKWRTCASTPAPERWVVANGDEGDPGSFVDRLLLEHDPHGVLEGLLLCAYAVGAAHGVVYIRSEYPQAMAAMQRAIEEAHTAGLLGADVAGSGFAFDVTVFPGMGSYVCGEETALLNAVEGFRGEVRLRPPYPAVAGLFGMPTVVNNVETLANVPHVLSLGAEAYRALGTADSAGTKALCLNAGFARPGVLEVPFGVTLREVVEEAGGGAGGVDPEAIILGGPMGSILFPGDWDVPVCYGEMGRRGIQLGHGGLVALPAGTDPSALLRHWLEFMVHESCGKCVPCRLGSARGLDLAKAGGPREELEALFDVMENGSLCAFGQTMPGPMRSILERWGDAALRATDGAGERP